METGFLLQQDEHYCSGLKQSEADRALEKEKNIGYKGVKGRLICQRWKSGWRLFECGLIRVYAVIGGKIISTGRNCTITHCPGCGIELPPDGIWQMNQNQVEIS
jgi:hypothetical protein